MTIHHLVITCVAIGVTASATFADRIELRRSIRRSVDAPIRLADVAALEGDHARRFADLVVLPIVEDSAGRVDRVHVSEIRRLLDAAGVDWGRIDLAGGEITVRPAVVPAIADPNPKNPDASPVELPIVPTPTVVAPTVHDGFRTLAEVMNDESGPTAASIARQIAAHWSFEGPDLDSVLVDADLSSLQRLPDRIKRCRLSVIGGTLADLIHVKVEGVDDAGRRPAVLVSVRIRILASVPIATAGIGSGRPVAGLGHDVVVERRPVRPSILEDPRRLVDAGSIAGRKTRRAIEPGDVLTRDLFVPETVIRRGDHVMVVSEIGGYRITYTAVATTDGVSDGRVTCRSIDGERTATFSTQVVGPGRVRLSSRSR